MNGAYVYPIDGMSNCCSYFRIVNGCITFHQTPVSYESLQKQNYWLTNMVMHNIYWNNYTNFYYHIVNEHQVIGNNKVVKRRKLDEHSDSVLRSTLSDDVIPEK